MFLEPFSNRLTELDVTHNSALTELWCDSNPLTELDVSQNTKLEELGCESNQLTSLDISPNTALTILWCGSNQLATLDISRNTALTSLDCGGNPGDGISAFPITAWFDNAAIPDNLYLLQKEWQYGDKLITIDIRKAE